MFLSSEVHQTDSRDLSSEVHQADSRDLSSEVHQADSKDLSSEVHQTDPSDLSSEVHQADNMEVSSDNKNDCKDLPSENNNNANNIETSSENDYKDDCTDLSLEIENEVDLGHLSPGEDITYCMDTGSEKDVEAHCVEKNNEAGSATPSSEKGIAESVDVGANEDNKTDSVDPCSVQDNKTNSTRQPSEIANSPEDNPEFIARMFSTGKLLDLIQSYSTYAKISSAKTFLDRFKQPKMKAKSKSLAILMDVDVLHSFAELQACMQAGQALNELLESPLTRIPVSEVFCGTFLFYFYRELRSRKKPEAYLYEAVGQCPLMNAVIKVIRNLVMDAVRDNVIVTDVTPTRRRSKKKKVKTPEMNWAAFCDDGKDGGDDDDDGDGAANKLVAKCDLVNRFGCLMEETPFEL